jgi:enoyl-CoA hydratase/carnithine racemase
VRDALKANALVRIDDEGDVQVVTMSRPPVNALSSEFRHELTEVLNSLVSSDASVIIIRGEGKGFSAGADVKEFQGRRGDATRTAASLSAGQRFWEAVYDIQVPTVAAMHGFAIGAGLVLSSLCDFRLASANCTMSMPEIEVGISVAGGGAQLRRLGLREGFIRDLLLNGHAIGADKALNEGLVDRVLPDEGFKDASLAWAKELARHGRPALLAMKAALNLTESVADWRTGNALTRSLSLNFVESKLGTEIGGA